MKKNTEGVKRTLIASVAYQAREASKKYDLKLNLNDKERKVAQLWEKGKSKPISYLRGVKRMKNPKNPEV